MDLSVNKAYNFIFHPFSEQHSKAVQALAFITDIALTIMTGALFLVVFSFVQLKDRDIKVNKEQTPESKIGQTILLGQTKEQADQLDEMKGWAKEGDLNKFQGSWYPGEEQNNENQIQPENHLLKSEDISSQFTLISEEYTPDLIKEKQAEQLEACEKWAENGTWEEFHTEEYDSFMFPIAKNITQPDDKNPLSGIEFLKLDEGFMKNYLRGIELMAKSLGWNIEDQRQIENRSPTQTWENNEDRLDAIMSSLESFKKSSTGDYFDEMQVKEYFDSMEFYRIFIDNEKSVKNSGA